MVVCSVLGTSSCVVYLRAVLDQEDPCKLNAATTDPVRFVFHTCEIDQR